MKNGAPQKAKTYRENMCFSVRFEDSSHVSFLNATAGVHELREAAALRKLRHQEAVAKGLGCDSFAKLNICICVQILIKSSVNLQHWKKEFSETFKRRARQMQHLVVTLTSVFFKILECPLVDRKCHNRLLSVGY